MALPNLPAIIQSSSANSTAAAPATLTHNFTATAQGSTGIIMLAGAPSAAPSASIPSFTFLWSATSAGNGATISCFAWANMPAGQTSAVMTLTNYNGAASAFWEVANLNTVTPAMIQNARANNGTTAGALGMPAVINTLNNTFVVAAIANVTGQVFTPANVDGTSPWTTGPTATSTLGATNIVLNTYTIAEGAYPSGIARFVGSMGGAAAWATIVVPFYSLASVPFTRGPVGAMVGNGEGYAVGI